MPIHSATSILDRTWPISRWIRERASAQIRLGVLHQWQQEVDGGLLVCTDFRRMYVHVLRVKAGIRAELVAGLAKASDAIAVGGVEVLIVGLAASEGSRGCGIASVNLIAGNERRRGEEGAASDCGKLSQRKMEELTSGDLLYCLYASRFPIP